MRRAILFAALFLADCGGTQREQAIEIQTVNMPVAKPCVDDSVPVAGPAYTDTKSALLGAPDHAARYDLMAKNWAPRDARLALLENVVAICRTINPPAKKVAQ